MILSDSLLVSLVKLIDRIPMPPPPPKRARGRPVTYPDRLMLKALVIMIIRRLYTAWALLRFLDQPDPLVPPRRRLLTDVPGRYPSRRTGERRLARLPTTVPARIGCLGRLLVQVLTPWAEQGHGAALDSTALRARGGVWHKRDREPGVVPHTSIDTEAAWSKSGWHGWWYGWKLHLAVTIGRLWIPLAR
jgi:hypothetical protein